ncbi:MAG TPA: D-2-hydroxyacid dehydrogenase [Clostridia bacterium]|nr:D-2-hydroxyacid dehydrogenase [Clostridia bacterium]
MEKVTVITTHDLDERLINKIRSVDPRIDLIVAADRQGVKDVIESADILFGARVTREALRRAKRLKWIQTSSAGIERILFPELVESDIILTNARGMHASTVAEHVMAFALVFARNLHIYLRNQASGIWDRAPGLPGLSGKTMGILGIGGIGKEVAKKAKAFDMRVVALKRKAVDTPPAHVDDLFYGKDGLLQLLELSDYVAVTLPLTRETTGLIGEYELKRMKRSAVLINVARGAVVDEEALIFALENGIIRGAALDVFSTEPLPSDSKLYSLPNVILTPHVAGTFEAYMETATELFCENLRRFLDGRPLLNVVSKDEGY